MDYAAFRAEAKEQGLIVVGRTDTKPYFYFDLNQGSLISEQSATKVVALINLARRYADSADYGEHNALLSLVTEWNGEDFDRTSGNAHQPSFVHWHRPYYTNARQNPEKWITLESWLTGEGFTISFVA
ncbi:MAG: hypothetical protein WAP52_04530 [Candidatus Sungiibacteriota bacterium]